MPLPKGIYIKPDSPDFWASYKDARGKRIRRSTGVPRAGGKEGEREAEAILGKWKADVHQERIWGRAPETAAPTLYTFDQVMLEYFKDCVPGQRGGLKRAKSTAKPLYLAFHDRPMDECDVKSYVRQRQAEGKAPGTINKELVMLSAACNFVREELGWDVSNPAAGRKLAEPEGIVRWLEIEEAGRLIQAAANIQRAPWLVDFVVLALNTGCRSGELLELEWSRTDLRENLIYLEARHTKANRRRSVPLNGAAREAILCRARYRAECCPDSPWVFCKADGSRLTTVKKSFATALRQAGITNFRPHDQRHTAAVYMLRAGATLPEIRDVLGHSTIKVTERYAHVAPEQVRATVEKIKGVSRSGHAETKNAAEKRRKSLF